MTRARPAPIPSRRGRAWGVLTALIALTVAGVAGHDGVAAQPRSRPFLIGALTEAWGPTPLIVGLRNGLVELGYRENHDFAIGVRFTQGDPSPAELEAAARQLIESGAQLIVTGGGGNAPKAALAATRTVPIVFLGGSDPVGMGLVESFRRPGGNVTGIADLDVELAPKRLEIFRELIPGLKRVLFPYDAGEPNADAQLARHREAAARLGVALVASPLHTLDEARSTLAGARKGDVDGIFAPRSISLNIPAFILETMTARGIPAMFHSGVWVERGGLASYSANAYEVARQAARLVDRIIKGAKPADLPVEQAVHFELLLNLKAARALGLTIPRPLLLRADRVIQ